MSELSRFRLLATFVAGRSLEVLPTAAGERAYTDGRRIFLPPASLAEQRRMVLIQAALLHAGSLEVRFLKALRGKVGARYLALEGARAGAELATRVPSASALPLQARSHSAEESLALAQGKTPIADPPAWFGAIHPGRMLASPPPAAGQQVHDPQRTSTRVHKVGEDDDDGDQTESKILKLFENPLFASQTMADFFRKLFGSSRGSGKGSSAGGAAVSSVSRAKSAGPNARPLPVPLRVMVADRPGVAAGVGGALYPEWDVHSAAYRPAWCRVLEFPLRTAPDLAAAGVAHDESLRRRLGKLGLGPKLLRRRQDGDELDLEALIELCVDLRAGHSPIPHVYTERRKIARNLGVLILVDASGSASDVDARGWSVHEHQRRAAATLALTLEELGDRVAVYGFRSQGRSSVQCLAIKPFAQRFSAGGRARLNQLQPEGFTRLGAGIRHAGEILKTQAGTPHRLLLVLSDGFPYDDGYEAGYAEGDARRALEELRADGVACLCLALGSSTPVDALQRVFGPASHASAPRLADLSARMDELFLSALKELAAPNVHDRRRSRARPPPQL